MAHQPFQNEEQPKQRSHGGFTLVELIVTMTLAGIVLAIAVPNFQSLIRSNRLNSTANEFVAFFNLTRNEAIRRGTSVSLCKSTNGTACTTAGGWQAGWLVFADTNANGTVDGGEDLIKVHEALDGKSTFVSTVGTAGSLVTFNGSGFVSQSGTLALCNDGKCFNLTITSPARIRSERLP